MRTIKLSSKTTEEGWTAIDEMPIVALDWSDDPLTVLEAVDEALAERAGAPEILVLDCGDDSVCFTLIGRDEPTPVVEEPTTDG